MSTYRYMQYDLGLLRQQIRLNQGKQKWHLILALFLRDTALLGFAIAYIGLFVSWFGPSASYVGVASFCMLLSIRFVDYGMNVYWSIVALTIVLAVMLVNSWLLPLLPPLLGFIVNSVSILLILRLTTLNPAYGNGGLYVFSYLLITGTPGSVIDLEQRAIAFVATLIICGLVLVQKHHAKNRAISLWQVVTNGSLNDEIGRWQLRLTFGVSAAVLVGQLLQVDRTMWIGFACMSALLPQKQQLLSRAATRFFGVVTGSILFWLLLQTVPENWAFLLAPVAGFGLGLTTNYFLASLFNSFGALSIAITLFGEQSAVMLRIFNNGTGVGCALLVTASILIGQKIIQRRQPADVKSF